MNREERRTAAREGIQAATHRQLAEGGCASASMAAVAARAGVAAGTLYRHFPSRAELLAEVVGDALRGEHALLARASTAAEARGGVPAGTPSRGGVPAETSARGARDALAAWVRTATDRALAAPALMHALLEEPADPAVDAVRLRERQAQEATLAALLARGADAGAWPRDDPIAQAAAIGGALRAALVGAAARERLGPRPDPRLEADALQRFVLAAVRALP